MALWLTSNWFRELIVDSIIRNIQSVKREIIDAIDDIGIGVVHDKRSKSLTLIRVHLDTSITIEGVITLMQLTDTQKFSFTFGKPIDSKGAPAVVQDGSVTLTVSDGNGSIVPKDGDPFSGTFVADKPAANITTPGTIVCKADADTGDGVETITGVIPVVVTGGKAVGFGEPTIGPAVEQ